jgi:hypothetical protein
MHRLLIALFILGGSLSIQAEPIDFTFNPPDSMSFYSTTVSTRYRVTNGETGPVDTTEVASDHILRKVDSGWTLSTLPESVASSRSGEDADNPIMEAVGMSTVTLHLNAAGEALSADGFDGLLDRIDSLADSATAAAARRALDPQQLAASQVTEWNSRIMLLTQLSMDVGDISYEQAVHELPRIGRLQFFTATEFVDTSRINGRLAGEVRITSHSDPEGFGSLVGLTLKEVQNEFNIPDSMVDLYANKGGYVSSTVDMTFDIETLMPFSETGEQVVHVAGTPPGGEPQVMEMVDRQEKQYRYPRWSEK